MGYHAMETSLDIIMLWIMPWQDKVIAIGQWLFVIALIPTIKARDKPALSTSLMTGTILGVFAFTFTTLSLWISALSTLLVSGMWFILALQKYRQIKKKN